MKFRKRRRYSRSPVPAQLLIIIVPLVLIGIIYFLFRTTPEGMAEQTVSTFYKHEQNNDYASSWDLFHPQMKNIFTKGDYVQYRNGIFVTQLGAKTFDFTVGEAKSLSTWKMTEESEALFDVYEVPIIQSFKSTFGNFKIHQNVYVVKEEGNWKILWSYE